MKQRPSFPVKLEKVAQTRNSSVSTTPAWGNGQKNIGKKLPDANAASGFGLDSKAVRANMVKKLLQSGLDDDMVLQAMETVPRHTFIDSALANQAYEDTSLPIGFGQTISKPNVVARMIELLRQGRNLKITGKLGRVLEIGTGCGYQAAVLSLLSKEVYSIERIKGLHEKAKENLRPLRLPNVHLIFGDGIQGYADGAPYAGIIAAAGGDNIPKEWIDQLDTGGRIVAPVVTTGGKQSLVVIDKTKEGIEQNYLENVLFVPLKPGII
ncbi:MAG: protein-L-isoaspartate(D-aspartate) O-methyltransferase [Limnohabitans sp.]|nr:protein-L-isoaspartate(D-aspartate) O-methyltransferase [Limnohabitans sp.]